MTSLLARAKEHRKEAEEETIAAIGHFRRHLFLQQVERLSAHVDTLVLRRFEQLQLRLAPLLKGMANLSIEQRVEGVLAGLKQEYKQGQERLNQELKTALPRIIVNDINGVTNSLEKPFRANVQVPLLLRLANVLCHVAAYSLLHDDPDRALDALFKTTAGENDVGGGGMEGFFFNANR